MKIILTHRDEIVSKREDEYQYSPLETVLSKFFPLLGECFFRVMSFFPIIRVFFLTFSLVKTEQGPARFRCLKTHGFRACVEEKYLNRS